MNPEKRETVVISESAAQKQLRIIQTLKEEMKEELALTGKQKTMFITTFGCQMNARDSEKLKGILEEIGYVEAQSEAQADFIIYNTCTVRENANLKIYGRLGHLNKMKQKNPNLMIALCGCMMQEDTVIEKIKKSYRFVDIIFGTHNIYKLAELLQAKKDSKGMIIDIWKEHQEIVEDLPSDRKYKFKASVNIMYGCNNFCTYCIVPYVRGRERSRQPQDILREICTLVEDGVKEITLLGQNVNSYGKTLDNKVTFAELLYEIEKIEGLERIRFMTSHPKDLSDDLIEYMRTSKKLCNHLHLPVQSGSTRLLKKMNRSYTKEHYMELIHKIKAARPDLAITTDIIVGFPGETEEDFEETLDVVSQAAYDSAFTFIYSERSGTPAAVMEEKVSDEVSRIRFNRLLAAIQPTVHKITNSLVGKTEELLVEEINEQNDKMLTGRLGNNHLVHFEGSRELIGEIVKVELIESKGFYLIGKLANA